jgi:hypothetical protein
MDARAQLARDLVQEALILRGVDLRAVARVEHEVASLGRHVEALRRPRADRHRRRHDRRNQHAHAGY